MIKSLALSSLMLGSLFFLTSCASLHAPIKNVPNKAFTYSFQNSRVLSESGFSKLLATGKQGSIVKIMLHDNKQSTAKLGRNFFSASGYQCRRYKVPSHSEYVACKINGRWYEASPIIISN